MFGAGNIFKFIFIVILLQGCTSIKDKSTDDKVDPIYGADANTSHPYESTAPESSTQSSIPVDSGAKNSVLDGAATSSDGAATSTENPEAATSTENPEVGSENPNDSGNCEERQFYIDNDNDGFGDPTNSVTACEPPPGFIVEGGDCDDDCETCFPGATESCGNNKDDNCDGSVDETCPCTSGAEQPCGLDEGECHPGTQSCVNGTWGDCVGATEKSEETCDNLDNDCDGVTDNLAARECGTDVGACTKGTQTCTSGTWGDCSGKEPGPKELCDRAGVDENCNGSVNENCKCIQGDTDDCGTTNVGECDYGTETCTLDGEWGDCTGEKTSKLETCNGKDDDCDGQTDEFAICLAGMYCSEGSCRSYCGNGTIDTGEECDDGNTNDNDFCSTDCKKALYSQCEDNSDCPGTLTCLLPDQAGVCTKPCAAVSDCPVPDTWEFGYGNGVNPVCTAGGCAFSCGAYNCPAIMVCGPAMPVCGYIPG